MEASKAETPEDEREISLNETSLKKPLDAIGVVGGHGPWQFRQWVVFFAATLCNAMVLFSALFLPSQMYCYYENATDIYTAYSSTVKINSTSRSSKSVNYVRHNGSDLDINCNSTDCKTEIDDLSRIVPATEFMFNKECSKSEIEIYAKCSYVVACVFSILLVYLSTDRFGRRPLSQISCLFLVASSLGSSWAASPPVFLILRFVASLGVFCIYLISAFSLMEYVHKDFKFLYFFTGHLGWGVAHFFLTAVAWMATDWMSFNLIVSAFCVLLAVFVWLGPESPTSFPNGGEQTRTRKALKYAAYVNGYSTTDVDLLSHNFRQRQENKHDLDTLASTKTKIFLYIIYSSILFLISFTTTFLYFAAKWHPEWFKVSSTRISFSFLGTTDAAATIILLFLTCLVPVKYLWACVSAMSSALLIIIFSRKNKNSNSKSSAVLYVVTVFFASAAWTLVLAKSICYKISGTIAKLNLFIIAFAIFSGALAASAVVLKVDDGNSLIVLAIPHLVSSIAVVFLPDCYFGGVS